MDLKTARQLRSETQEQFAQLIGVTHALVSMWEKGKTPVPIKRQKQIEKLTGWPIDWESKQKPQVINRRRTSK